MRIRPYDARVDVTVTAKNHRNLGAILGMHQVNHNRERREMVAAIKRLLWKVEINAAVVGGWHVALVLGDENVIEGVLLQRSLAENAAVEFILVQFDASSGHAAATQRVAVVTECSDFGALGLRLRVASALSLI